MATLDNHIFNKMTLKSQGFLEKQLQGAHAGTTQTDTSCAVVASVTVLVQCDHADDKITPAQGADRTFYQL